MRIKAIGIDHGTSNSAICTMRRQPYVILPNGVNSVMPSVVFMFDTGRELVGWDARNATITHFDKGIGYKEYKRNIGQDDEYVFCNGKKVLKAPDLGALVIRTLLKAYQADIGGDENDLPKAAVITVPATFDQSACEGTREAARRAGLECYPLLQEPIAASLAYGFTEIQEDAQWMVFDLGGGTLDISLVYVRNGQPDVPKKGHYGDPQLGGKDFDKHLYDYALAELRKEYKLEGFEKDDKYRRARNLLMMAVEDAKIELSNLDETCIQTREELCKDDSGKSVKVGVPIARSQYEKMIMPEVEKALHHCKILLELNNLRSDDIHSLILVGGPTKTPLLRKMLSDHLSIELRDSIDPMTAVAQGAALYAESYEWPIEVMNGSAGTSVPTGKTAIRLVYQNHSGSTVCPVNGMLIGHTDSTKGMTVEIKALDRDWSSGSIQINEDGEFECDLELAHTDQPHRCDFVTTARNSKGEEIASIEEPQVWHPYVVIDGALKVANSLRVAVTGNQTETLLDRGEDLPCYKMQEFETAKDLKKGKSGDLLRVPVVESVANLVGIEDDHADACFLVGTLPIEADDERVNCDVPQGSTLEITLLEDESRLITVKAYVPLLNEEFEATFTPSSYGVSLEDVSKQFEIVKQELVRIEQLQKQKPNPEVKMILATVRRLDTVESIANDLKSAREGQQGALYRAYRHMLELQGTVYQIVELQRTNRIEYRTDQLTEVVEDGLEKDELEMIRADYSSCDPEDAAALTRIEKSLDKLDLKVRGRPYAELGLDLQAMSGKRANNHQRQVFDEADKLWNELDQNGGIDALSDGDLKRIDRIIKEIDDAYPDLDEWRREVIEKWEKSGWPLDKRDEGTDVKLSR